LFGKSLRAASELKAGTIILPTHVMVRGPGKGLSPSRMDELIGKRIHRDIKKGDVFIEEDIEGRRKLNFSNSFSKRWGLISRFNDMEEMLSYKPKLIELHLAEKDFNLGFKRNGSYSQDLVVHAPEYIGDCLLDLCTGDEDIRSASVKMVQKTIAVTETLAPHFNGRPKVIIHPGAMSLNTKLDKARLRQALIRSLNEINGNGTEILLENLPPYPWYFGGQWKGNYFMDSAEIRSFCEDTECNICFDLSHAALFCNAKDEDLSEFIQTVKPYIRHIHLADAYGLDGEGVQIGEGDIDFETIMPLFSDYLGTWVPEVWRGHLQNGRGFIDSLMRLKRFNM